METQNRNMGGNLSYRNSRVGSKKEGPQVKSLRSVGGLPGAPSEPKPLKGFNSLSPQPNMRAERSSENRTPSHSKHSSSRSEHYHAKIIGQDPRLVDELNPTKAIKASRSFPGLANGE